MTKIKKVQAPDGTIIKVEGPDDATDEQFIQEGIRLYSEGKKPMDVGIPPDARTAGQVAADQAVNVLSGVPQALMGIPGSAMAIGKAGISGLGGNVRPMGDLLAGLLRGAYKQVETPVRGAGAVAEAMGLLKPGTINPPSQPEWEQNAQQAGGTLESAVLGKLLPQIADKFPMKGRAAANFEKIEQAVKSTPMAAGDVAEAQKALADALQLREYGGGQLSQPLRAFKTREATLQTDPMLYPESFKRASFAKRTASTQARSGAITDMMKSASNTFADALQTGNRNIAAQAGLGEFFDEAMKEYAQATRIGNAAEVVKKWSARAGLATALGAAGGAGYDAMHVLMRSH